MGGQDDLRFEGFIMDLPPGNNRFLAVLYTNLQKGYLHGGCAAAGDLRPGDQHDAADPADGCVIGRAFFTNGLAYCGERKYNGSMTTRRCVGVMLPLHENRKGG